MATAAAAELFELQPVGGVLLVLRRYVIAFLALRALQNDIVSRHNLYFAPKLVVRGGCMVYSEPRTTNLTGNYYSTISETVPAPTVRPPSRIANLNPFSIAIGAIRVISIWMLSPGITISTPAGRFATPVTSVVRK